MQCQTAQSRGAHLDSRHPRNAGDWGIQGGLASQKFVIYYNCSQKTIKINLEVNFYQKIAKIG